MYKIYTSIKVLRESDWLITKINLNRHEYSVVSNKTIMSRYYHTIFKILLLSPEMKRQLIRNSSLEHQKILKVSPDMERQLINNSGLVD